MEATQIKQLKINVTNISSFLKDSNNTYIGLKKKNSALISRQVKRRRQEIKEKKLESKKDPQQNFGLGSVGNKVASTGASIFDKIMGFGSFLLAGVFVNSIPQILRTVTGVINSIVDFVTPIQSAFSLIVGFIQGDFDKKKYDVDKKRVDDSLSQLSGDICRAPAGALQISYVPELCRYRGDGGLVDQLAEKTGPLESIIKALKPAIDLVRGAVGGKKNVLSKQGGKEGVLNTETGEFTEKQFTSAERKKYESGSTDSGGSGGGATDISGIGDGREDVPVPLSGGILDGAKQIIGMGKGTSDQCANTTRAALRKAGHPMANVRTQLGDLDTPQGIAYNAPSFAASFGGSDMGQVIKTKSNIKAGDIILWRADRDLGGILNKGAITHVGIAADDGLKHQFDHNKTNGFHYRRHWHSSGGTSWFAGIRLGSGRGASKMVKANLSTNTQGSGDIRASLSNPENRSKVNQISTINQSMDEEGGQTIILAKQKVIVG